MACREDRIQAAKAVVDAGEISMRRAAMRYDIPKSTLHDHISGHKTKCRAGRPTILSELEEKVIVRSCQELAQLRFGVDRHTVGAVVHNYLSTQGRETPFKDGTPGIKWWRGFLRRWPSLSERKPQHFPSNRAEASTPEAMDSFFQHLIVNKINNHIIHKKKINNCKGPLGFT